VKTILLNNGYPTRVINKQIKDRLKVKNSELTYRSKTHVNNVDNKSNILVVPYVSKVSNDIKRIVKNVTDVRFTIPKKLDNVIRKSKDRLNDFQSTKVVYKIVVIAGMEE